MYLLLYPHGKVVAIAPVAKPLLQFSNQIKIFPSKSNNGRVKRLYLPPKSNQLNQSAI
jgi:hypothetical protein